MMFIWSIIILNLLDRDAPQEYSTVPFDMEPEILPEGAPVPVNNTGEPTECLDRDLSLISSCEIESPALAAPLGADGELCSWLYTDWGKSDMKILYQLYYVK